MRNLQSCVVGAAVLGSALLGANEPAVQPSPAVKGVVTRVSFGSCHKTGRNEQIWERVADTKPQLFLFMGDNVYADTEDMKEMREAYAKLNETPEYRAMRKATQVLAMWDDHDYGANDAGREFPMRKQSRDIQLDAFAVPKEAPVRKREGLYQSYTYGEKGKRLQIILLDTRYFRSPLQKKGKTYIPVKGKDVTMLGEAQWKWLEKELSEPAELRILVSSIQILNDGHRFEKWGNMPEERERLIQLLDKKGVSKHSLLLSGDRHMSEFSRMTREGKPDLWEVTSSGMTHGGGGYADKNPWGIGKRYASRSFGSLQIEWAKKLSLTLKLHDNDGNVVREQVVKMQ